MPKTTVYKYSNFFGDKRYIRFTYYSFIVQSVTF